MNRKQIATALLGVSVLFNIDAGIQDWFKAKTASFKRGTQCAFAPGKYNCSSAEKAKGRKWLIGVSVGAATAAAAAIGIGISANEMRKRKAAAEAEEARLAAEAARAAEPKLTIEAPAAPISPIIPEAPTAPDMPQIAAQKPKRIPSLETIQALAKDVTQTAKASVTPMQAYFEREVIPHGTNIIQQASQKTKKLLEEKTAQANQALRAPGELKEAFIEKATKKLKEAEAVGNQFIQTIQQQGPQFFNNALEQVVGVNAALIQEMIAGIKGYVARMVTAINPIHNVRLMGQLNALTSKISEFSEKAARLVGKWRDALSELAARTAWIHSHVRPVALGGKTNEQIVHESAQLYPLAKIADDLWAFYPQVVREINGLKLGGPGVILQTFLMRASELLNTIQILNEGVGKVGKVLISSKLAEELEDLKLHLKKLADQIRQTLTVSPILKEFPSSTATALLEAARGYTWRVGTGLTNQITNRANSMKNIYNTMMAPAITQVNRLQGELMSIVSIIPEALKEELVSKVKDKPLLNTVRAPYILAQSLGKSISVIKGKINQIATQAGIIINGLAQILSEAPSLARIVNTAVGGEFVNSGIIEGLEDINRTSSDIAQTVIKLNSEIQQSAAIVPGQ